MGITKYGFAAFLDCVEAWRVRSSNAAANVEPTFALDKNVRFLDDVSAQARGNHDVMNCCCCGRGS